MKVRMKLYEYEAIEHAEKNGLTLSKYADPTEEAREGLTPEEARKIAAEDPRLIWLDLGDVELTEVYIGHDICSDCLEAAVECEYEGVGMCRACRDLRVKEEQEEKGEGQ